eukprot:scaffold15122_cov140-Isochrysis_galbana.AAC.2
MGLFPPTRGEGLRRLLAMSGLRILSIGERRTVGVTKFILGYAPALGIEVDDMRRGWIRGYRWR